MATMRAAVKAKLTGDSTLMATLTGGVHDADDLDRTGLTPETAGVYDSLGKLKPCSVIRWRGSDMKEIVANSERRFFEVWLYEDRGWNNIETAKRRIKTLLHRKQVASSNEGLCFMSWAGDLGEFVDDEMGGASADRLRFYIDYTRK